MAQDAKTFSIRMDSNLKKQFDELCVEFGMNTTTAITIFARAVVAQRRIPFEIKSVKNEVTRESGPQAFQELRKQAQDNGIQGMSLDEINDEIRQTRKESGDI